MPVGGGAVAAGGAAGAAGVDAGALDVIDIDDPPQALNAIIKAHAAMGSQPR